MHLSQDELMIHEKILLQTVMFDLVVENPYTHMLDFSKNLMELATKAKKKEEKVEGKSLLSLSLLSLIPFDVSLVEPDPFSY